MCISRGALVLSQIIGLFGGFSFAQYPLNNTVEVTIYDHCSGDRTTTKNNFNPKKDSTWEYGIQKGYVKNKLDSNGKPVLDKKNVINDKLNHWYKTNDTPGCPERVVAIKDSLIFTHKDNGIYQFSSDRFFRLDNRGLVASGEEKKLIDKDGTLRNFGFTMELKGRFTYKKDDHYDQELNFFLDDDTWIFINGQLVLDMGGIHSESANIKFSTIVDQLGLKDGDECTLSLFYAERLQMEAIFRAQLPLLLPPRKRKNLSYHILKIR